MHFCHMHTTLWTEANGSKWAEDNPNYNVITWRVNQTLMIVINSRTDEI